jgi:Bifunctional DNA primase/polymerase, N-terminal
MSWLEIAALAWLDRGFAVFPIKPMSKVPLGGLVPRGFLDASKDPAVIREWWRLSPTANIGVRTGGGFFVIDLDGAEAAAWFSNACGRHGGAPKTLTVRTARGFHAFFACAGEVPNSAGRLAPGADVRGDGGYVVTAPSIHPSGAVYTIARDLAVADAPRWLINLAMPDEGPAQTPGPMPVFRPRTMKLRGLASILSLMANAREGERNRLLFWGACRLGEMICEGLINEGEAHALVCEAGRRSGLKSHLEIKATAESGLSRGRS